MCICQLHFAKLGHGPILKATSPGQHSQIANWTQQRQVGSPKLATEHNITRSAFPNCQLNTTAPGRQSQIGNWTQQRQVGSPKLPTQHYYFAKLPSPLHPCGLPKWASSCPQIKN
jgi:hypothetical protein